jgi:hypothetical protein
MKMIAGRLNFLCLGVLLSASVQGQILKGKVVEASNCKGIPGLTVRLIPPKGAQDSTEVISSTDSDGSFRAEVRGGGRFYLKVVQGLIQVYGDEIKVDPGRQILITLRKTTEEVFSPLCLQANAAGPLLHGVHPIGLALLSSGILVLDEQGNYSSLWQAQPTGIVKLQAYPDRVIDVARGKVNGEEVICVLMNKLGRGVLTVYSNAMRQMKQWLAPGRKPFTGFAVVASETIYLVVADADDGRSFAILKLDLNSNSSELQEVARLAGSEPLNVGSIAIDIQHNRLFAIDDVSGALYQVDLATRHSRSILVTERLQQTHALVVDATGGNLYAATSRHVWKIQLKANPVVRDFAPANLKFRLPAALVISPDGNIWVGDRDAQVIHLLTPEGQLVGSVR